MEKTNKSNDIVLIHDGVRPLITDELITNNINSVKEFGSAITVESARESVVLSVDGAHIDHVPERGHMYTAKAPQSFYFGQILCAYERAQRDNFKSIDSSHLLSSYDLPMHMVQSTKNNMKITDPADYYMFRALYEAMENQQIFGL
jgi:2-C-methyl-D-erythritol 4-phosphate cytidylyltransferase